MKAVNRRGFLAMGGALTLAGSGLLTACSDDGPRAATPADITDLRSGLRGQVLLPGDEGFDPARRPWNRTVDQSVRAVAEVADAEDVAALVRFAGEAGIALATQPNGHSPSPALDGTILVRTARLDEVRVDPSAATARVGAGVPWSRVQAIAGPAGLTGVTGSAPGVGITGYTLGGGLSWFGRKYGWAGDQVSAFEVIDAQGKKLRASATSETDLFWALRGGGGDYALVTAIEFALRPAPALYGGRMLWPVAAAPAVLAAFRQVTATAPDELSVWWSLFRFPSAPPMVGIDATYLGPEEQGTTLLRPFDSIPARMSDNRRVLPVTDLGSITGEPTDPSPTRQRGTLLTGLDDTVAQALLARPIDPLLSVQIRHLGGALARPSDSAAGPIAEPYCVNFTGLQTAPGTAAALDARVAEYLDILRPVDSGRTPFTLLAPDQSAAEALAHSMPRLREIKRDRDPDGVFRSNFPVLT
ncbi:FAD-binding oxidoreductase [Nocardia sp. NPDC059177]|uniref:FAD-binding oxidoreductase n=1 Tax=Nocardia sp. NPDC059177 TaxID=3346759 RepID=UPI0036826EE9